MADTLVIGNGDDKLYRFSGEFTSTIKTSQAIGGIDQFPNDLSYDGNTPWTGDEAHKLYLTSGLFTSTIKTSIITTSIDTTPNGISSNHGDTPWMGTEADKMYQFSGQFTSTLKDSEPVPASATNPHGITYTADKYAGYTMFCTTTVNGKLYFMSGVFTSTIKDSQSVFAIDTSPQSVTYNGTDSPWVGFQAQKLYLTSGRYTSTIKTSQGIGGIDSYPRGIETTDYEARIGSIPDPPTGVNVVAGVEKNTITWTSDPDATSDNIYWANIIMPDDDFADIDDWTLEIKTGTGTITNPSGVIRLDIPDFSTNDIRAVNNNSIPSGDFEIIVDIVGYAPDSTSDGQKAEIRVRNGLSETDYVVIFARSIGVSSYIVRAGYRINDVWTWFGGSQSTGNTIASKLRARRIGTVLYVDYYSDSLWTNFGNHDYTTRASLIDEFAFGCADINTRGGYAEFDNFIWKLKSHGTKIAGVTSPYNHLSLTPGLSYYYVITGENFSGESNESTMVDEKPLPDEPENPNATPDILKNIITWDSVAGADKYNIYWLNTSPVTKGTGNKLADKTSPYIHQPLTGGLPYYYVITAEASGVEGNESSEFNATPFSSTPAAPQNFEIVEALSGDSQIVLQWDIAGGSTSYNIYFIKRSELEALIGLKTTSFDADFIKQYGTKIDGITNTQYTHRPLLIDHYYYVVSGINQNGEGDLSDVLLTRVMFEGKIFDHNSEALDQLAYQYQGE